MNTSYFITTTSFRVIYFEQNNLSAVRVPTTTCFRFVRCTFDRCRSQPPPSLAPLPLLFTHTYILFLFFIIRPFPPLVLFNTKKPQSSTHFYFVLIDFDCVSG